MQIFLTVRAWKQAKRFLFSACLLLLGCLSGCGGGDDGIGERLSGPANDGALPIRIDATVTPTSTPTPESELLPEEFPTIGADQFTPTPLSEEEPISPTPTFVLPSEDDAETELSENEPSPVPSPSPLPSLTPTATVVTEDTSASKNAQKGSEKNLSVKQAEAEPEKKGQKTLQKEESEPEQETDADQSEDAGDVETDDDQRDSSEAVVNSSAIRLDRVVLCSKITNRNPVNAMDKFSLAEVGKIYTWMQVSRVKPPKTVKHIYYREGKISSKVTLKLGYASMRTWSAKTFKADEALGKWKVVITTNNEKEVLAVKEFTVTP